MRSKSAIDPCMFFSDFRNFPQFPRTPAPVREPPPQQAQLLPQDQFAPQTPTNNVAIIPPQTQNQRPRSQQPPPPRFQPQSQPQLQNIFGSQNSPPQQQFTLGPFTAFNNFNNVGDQGSSPVAAPPQPQPQQQPQPQGGRAPGLGFEAVRNTVVHDSGSQSSSFFSFQRPEFNRPPQPTRFPVAERPSPVQPAQTFFGSFPANLGTFVDPRSSSGGQRAQRALPEGATAPLEEELPSYRFPDAEFGGFVPIKSKKRY